MTTGELETPAEESRRILLVEDDLHVAETLAESLELEGYRVAVAHNAVAGLERVRREPVDLVLCDLTLPGEMDGFGFARTCRDDPDLHRLHLVAVSGYDRPEDRRRAQAAGFDGLVGKPIELARINAAFVAGRPAA
jgi:CheY-like chemotaxis protein